MDYNKQVEDFLKETNTTFTCEYLRHGKHFDDDKDERDIYKITLTRGLRSFSFDFGQSINCSGEYWFLGRHSKGTGRKVKKLFKRSTYNINKTLFQDDRESQPKPFFFQFKHYWFKNKNFKVPSAYDVLACLTKYDPGEFEWFCGDFGYDTDSKKAEKVYKAVVNEWHNVCMLWDDEEIEKLQEIN